MNQRAYCRPQSNTRLFGNSETTRALTDRIQRVAPYDSTVLITGPSGTGKELVARQLHASSNRWNENFIPVDCTGLTNDLMASQLFGHVKGAFTGAEQSSLGCFRAADRGTIFLDEIGELPLDLQCKLLRVIQERAVIPVGDHQASNIDVRIIAATNRDLCEEVRKGNFREDLYYRLSVFTIHTTPLRERLQDIAPIADSLLSQLESEGYPNKTLSPEALGVLEDYSWPGNVRELRNILEQAAIEEPHDEISPFTVSEVLSLAQDRGRHLSQGGTNGPEASGELPDRMRHSNQQRIPATESHWPKLIDSEKHLISATLKHTYFNKSAAARLLGISRQALLRKIAKYSIACPKANTSCVSL